MQSKRRNCRVSCRQPKVSVFPLIWNSNQTHSLKQFKFIKKIAWQGKRIEKFEFHILISYKTVEKCMKWWVWFEHEGINE